MLGALGCVSFPKSLLSSTAMLTLQHGLVSAEPVGRFGRVQKYPGT